MLVAEGEVGALVLAEVAHPRHLSSVVGGEAARTAWSLAEVVLAVAVVGVDGVLVADEAARTAWVVLVVEVELAVDGVVLVAGEEEVLMTQAEVGAAEQAELARARRSASRLRLRMSLMAKHRLPKPSAVRTMRAGKKERKKEQVGPEKLGLFLSLSIRFSLRLMSPFSLSLSAVARSQGHSAEPQGAAGAAYPAQGCLQPKIHADPRSQGEEETQTKESDQEHVVARALIGWSFRFAPLSCALVFGMLDYNRFSATSLSSLVLWSLDGFYLVIAISPCSLVLWSFGMLYYTQFSALTPSFLLLWSLDAFYSLPSLL